MFQKNQWQTQLEKLKARQRKIVEALLREYQHPLSLHSIPDQDIISRAEKGGNLGGVV